LLAAGKIKEYERSAASQFESCSLFSD